MIVELQCLPVPAGTPDHRYAAVEAAIAVVRDSGLHHEVGALGTTLEGEPDDVWPVVRRAHEACLAAGARHVVSVIKVAQAAPAAEAPTMAGLTGPFRGGTS